MRVRLIHSILLGDAIARFPENPRTTMAQSTTSFAGDTNNPASLVLRGAGLAGFGIGRQTSRKD